MTLFPDVVAVTAAVGNSLLELSLVAVVLLLTDLVSFVSLDFVVVLVLVVTSLSASVLFASVLSVFDVLLVVSAALVDGSIVVVTSIFDTVTLELSSFELDAVE